MSSIDGYAVEVRRTDAAIGKLISTLQSRAPDGRLVVFVTADHGEEFGEHRTTRHGSKVYGTSTRVPFVTRRSGADATAGLPQELPRNHVYPQRFSFFELYDLRVDPEERFDLEQQQPERVHALGDCWQRSTHDALVEKVRRKTRESTGARFREGRVT